MGPKDSLKKSNQVCTRIIGYSNYKHHNTTKTSHVIIIFVQNSFNNRNHGN